MNKFRAKQGRKQQISCPLSPLSLDIPSLKMRHKHLRRRPSLRGNDSFLLRSSRLEWHHLGRKSSIHIPGEHLVGKHHHIFFLQSDSLDRSHHQSFRFPSPLLHQPNGEKESRVSERSKTFFGTGRGVRLCPNKDAIAISNIQSV